MKYLTGIHSYIIKTSNYVNIPFFVAGIYTIIVVVLLASQSLHITRLEKGATRSNYEIEIETDESIKPIQLSSLYTQWGRKTCTARFSTGVYSGIAAGGLFSDTGGGSNILCLPMDPLWGNFTESVETASTIYGSEYEVSGYKKSPKLGLFWGTNARTINDHTIPCVVCETNGPGIVMMLPGRNECYTGWDLEYSGYLMTSHWKHKGRSSYLCIDKEPEADRRGYSNENGALFYHVQVQCGSLLCPPFKKNAELTCSVCSKRSVSQRSELS